MRDPEIDQTRYPYGDLRIGEMPDQCAQMLKTLHALVRQMLDSPVPILVAIRGQCLGGGLEVAADTGATGDLAVEVEEGDEFASFKL